MLSLWLAISPACAADYYFDYNAECAASYKAYMSLRVDEGDAIIRGELLIHPYNLMATFIADYGDCITLLFNGDPYQFTQRKAHEEDRLNLIARAWDNDPWKKLAVSGIRLHWALINMRRGEQLRAAIGFRRSYLLLKENAAAFPAFAADDALYGAEESLAGIIPDSYKWLTNILGMRGNFSAGLARLNNYLRLFPRDENPFHEEALLYSAFIRFQFGAAKQAVWQQISNDAYFPVAGNLMRSFFRANLAMSFRKADIAISTLRSIENNPGWPSWPVLDLELGSALLLKLDGSCLIYFDRYISRNRGKLFTKDALHMAALAAYSEGNYQLARAYKNRITTEGSLNTDADKQAQRFAKNDTWPQPLLLSARMLIDGGYAEQALQKLRTVNETTFTNIADRLEYNFRLGRALEDTDDAGNAVQVYQRVINEGRERPEHYAARAALQMAGIYESRNQKAEALRYYHTTLSMRNHDYQSGIDQQARAGLARLGE
jgi:hypothetical protein